MRIGIIGLLLLVNISLSAQNSISSSDFKDEILAVNRAMEEVFNRQDYAQIIDFYADSAIMVGRHIELIGQDTLHHYWGQFSGAEKWVLENTSLIQLGPKSALQRGFSNIYYYDKKELKISRSIFSLIWIQTHEGWKIYLDHFSGR